MPAPDPAVVARARWRRLDVPGHDVCRLVRHAGGWRLEGTAEFVEGARRARLDYSADCDDVWRTRRAAVRGRLGDRAVARHVGRDEAGGWTLDGVPQPGLERLADLDFGFTPATNLVQLRRIALGIGDAADVTVAWLDAESASLTALAQRYERRSERTYRYESPSTGYEADLEVDEAGFVRRYPGLWEAEG